MNAKYAAIFLLSALLTLFIATKAQSQENESTMFAFSSSSASHYLSWNPPLERTNGDALAPEDIMGYRIERRNDSSEVLEAINLEGTINSLAVTLQSGCTNYFAFAIATDGVPYPEGTDPALKGTLESVATDPIRICVVPPNPPRDFVLQ